MAKPNFSYEKRRKEIEKQKKREEKRLKKLEKKNQPEPGDLDPAPEGEEASETD